MRHLTEFRDVELVLSGGAMPIEAIGAIKTRIYDLEKQYQNSLDETGTSQNLDDLSGVTTVLTGNTPYQVFVFELTTYFAGGIYEFTFVEKAPNVETAPSLQ